MKKSDFNLEKKLFKKGYRVVIGIDEAGRGPLAGPVVACAVVLKSFQTTPAFGHPSLSKEGKREVLKWDLIRDSKKLSAKQREGIFDFIQENFYVGVGLCDHKTVDRINILEASFLAMKKAIIALKRNVNQSSVISHQKNLKRSDLSRPQRPKEVGPLKLIILVDGNKKIPNLSIEQMAVVGGDKIVKSISAASIIAKVTRDRIMLEMHKKYPQYQFDKHKGYGTKMHFETLKKNGPCEIHRKSFSPVKKLVKGDF